MKILKRVLGALAILVVLVLVTALFVKKDFKVEREIVINKPSAEVFSYIRQLKNQEYYSKWAMADPGKKTSFRGTDAAAGFIYAWDGNSDVGKGEQEIKKIEEGKLVQTELRFIKPFKGRADAWFTTDAIDAGSTKVKWGFSSSMPYPMNICRLFCSMEDKMGKDIETSLGNLKSVLEK